MKQFGVMVGLDKKNAFEGWFSKIDDKKNNFMFSVIWGYSTHDKTKHAFIQFQNNQTNETSYISYPIEDLEWKTNPFVLKIGRNQLSQKGIHLDFEMNGISVKGDLSFSSFTLLKKSLFKPNIMGILSYFPNECNHAIISMDHKVSGDLHIGNQTWNIRDANGYIEKDWGTSFPKEYVWVHANVMQNSSVVFSYATVPILGKFAKGFFLVLHHEGVEYRFSSIEGSKLTSFSGTENSFSAIIEKKGYRLSIKAMQSNPIALASPIDGEMKSSIKESLDGNFELIFERENQNTIVFSTQRASIDVHL